MWSEEKAVCTVSYDALPLLLRKELFKFNGTSAAFWMFQSVSGYDVWLIMNAREMGKLRRYYLHGGWDEAATLWRDIWDSWNTGWNHRQCLHRTSVLKKVTLQR